MRKREDHIKYCKEMAYKQFEYDISKKEHSQPDKAYFNACISMLSDLSKHPETENLVKSCGMLVFMVDDEKSMRKFIDGFN